MNWKTCLTALLITMTSIPLMNAAEKDTRVYEMRIYIAPEGKLDELNARFRNHTVRLFEKHGITSLGYWVPTDKEKGSDNTLIYVLSYPSREAAKASWANFMKDPDWLKAWKESEQNGKLVERVESIYMKPVDYSPVPKPEKSGDERIFELRKYTTPEGKLDDLHARFRDHTMKLFSKHGMTHVGYWEPLDKEKGAGHTLLYILAHDSREAARKSFDAFRADPAWIKAKTASEQNGSLTTPNGVESTFMKPVDYSPMK